MSRMGVVAPGRSLPDPAVSPSCSHEQIAAAPAALARITRFTAESPVVHGYIELTEINLTSQL